MSETESDTFSITDAQIHSAGVLAFACTIPGTCICFLVLVAYSIAGCFPKARTRFDRVSFRLLVYTLTFNVIFGIAYAATPTSPGPGCNFGAFAVNFTLSFATFFTTCIAINLQLVLVHGVNGKSMEKYYFIGTTILSLVLNVPTYALHQFGWDEDSATCWYKNHEPKIRLRWIIGTQSFWIALAATVETICSGVVLFWMYRFQKTTHLLTKAASQPALGNTTATVSTTRTPNSFLFTSSSRSTLVRQVPKYRKVILRISLYPIVSLMVNYSTVALDLNTTIRGMNTQLDYRLLVLDLILYGVRTLAYGVLAAMDPSFINAIRDIRRSKNPGSIGNTLTSINFATWGTRVGTILSSTTIHGESHKLQSPQKNDLEGMNSAFGLDDPESAVIGINSEVPQQLQADEIRKFERQL